MKYLINEAADNTRVPVSNTFWKEFVRASNSLGEAHKNYNDALDETPEKTKALEEKNKATRRFQQYRTQFKTLTEKALEQPELQRAEVLYGSSLVDGKFTKAKKRKDNAFLAFCVAALVFSVASVAVVVATGGAALIPFAIIAAVTIPTTLFDIRLVQKEKKRNRETELRIKEEQHKNELEAKDAQINGLTSTINDLQSNIIRDDSRLTHEEEQKEEITEVSLHDSHEDDDATHIIQNTNPYNELLVDVDMASTSSDSTDKNIFHEDEDESRIGQQEKARNNSTTSDDNYKEQRHKANASVLQANNPHLADPDEIQLISSDSSDNLTVIPEEDSNHPSDEENSLGTIASHPSDEADSVISGDTHIGFTAAGNSAQHTGAPKKKRKKGKPRRSIIYA